MRGLLAAVLFAAPSAFAVDCEQPTTTVQLTSHLTQAEGAFSQLDADGLKTAAEASTVDIQCLSEALPARLAASYHRIQGLHQFVSKDRIGSMQSFAAARSIEPGYTFPTDLVPEGNPVLKQYVAVDPESAIRLPIPEPDEGRITLNGQDTLERIDGLATIFQRFDGDGVLVETQILASGDPLPLYTPKRDVPDAVEGPGSVTRKSVIKPNVPLLAAGGGVLLASGALLVANRATYSRWETAPIEDTDRLRRQTNAFGIGTLAAAGVGAGLTVTGVFAGKF